MPPSGLDLFYVLIGCCVFGLLVYVLVIASRYIFHHTSVLTLDHLVS